MLTACGSDGNSRNNRNDKSGGVSQDKPKIVTSIKPIQAIVLAIAGDSADVEQLIPDYASPHDYSFKPSDIRKVENANIVFHIDEHMETQLNGVLDNLNKDNTLVVSLAGANGLTLLEASEDHHKHGDEDEHKESHAHEKEEHDHGDDYVKQVSKHDDHEGHKNHDNIDFHIWTSPKNAVLMANQVVKSLSDLDAKNAKQYQQNVESFYEQVKTESEKIRLKLTPFKHKPYIVFHNSWQYFADEYGLQKPIVVDIHEGISSGAKTISEIRDRIVKDNINCVFYDSSISTARLKVITEKAKTVEIDVLAKAIALDQTTYIKWLSLMGNQIESCLSK